MSNFTTAINPLYSFGTLQSRNTGIACFYTNFCVCDNHIAIFFIETGLTPLRYIGSGCSPPPSITNGSFSPQTKHFNDGASAIFSCDSGLILQGSNFLTCNKGVWDNDAPICKSEYYQVV